MSTELTSPYYRSYELPWEGEPESSRRFRKLLRWMLLLLLVFGILFPLLPTPQRTALESEVPERLARVMIQNKPKPPPPPPKPQEKPKVEPEKKLAMVTPPKPVDAHEKAQKQLNRFKDELADLRQVMDLTAVQAKNLSGAAQADARSERFLIPSKVGAGSGGINNAPRSRNFGNGAGQLGGHDTMAVASPVARSGLDSRDPRTGPSGKAGRSREEIEIVFDRNKGLIYQVYTKALRENPQLQGKLVLEFTIAPSGEVTMCRVVSTELNDKELEEKIVTRVRTFRFEPKDVGSVTYTKPIDFFPA
jgi:TonB family protein